MRRWELRSVDCRSILSAKLVATATSLEESKNNFRSFIYGYGQSYRPTNPANVVKIRLVDVEIIRLRWAGGLTSKLLQVYTDMHIHRSLSVKFDFCAAYRSDNFIVGLTNVSPLETAPTLGNYDVCGQYPGVVGQGTTVYLQCTCNTVIIVIHLFIYLKLMHDNALCNLERIWVIYKKDLSH